MTTDNKDKEKILSPWVGFTFIKRNTEKGILNELWSDDSNNKDKDPANQWKLVKSWMQEPDNRPIWVDTLEEALKLRGEGKKNVHIKSKPTTGPYFINDKGEICFQMTDEYDHMYMVRMDNPLKLNAEEATEMMKDLTKDIREKKEKDIDPKDRWNPEKFGRAECKDKKKWLHDQVDRQEEKEEEEEK